MVACGSNTLQQEDPEFEPSIRRPHVYMDSLGTPASSHMHGVILTGDCKLTVGISVCLCDSSSIHCRPAWMYPTPHLVKAGIDCGPTVTLR